MKKILPLICIVLAILLCSLACLPPEINNENGASNNDVQNSASSSKSQDDSAIGDDSKNDSSDDEETSTIDFSGKTYIAFGDSITYGADYTRAYAPMDNPYPTLVASTLKMKSYKNAGVSGATLCTNTLDLSCISDIVTNTSTTYDIISLLGGVNDYNRNLPLGSFGDSENDTIYGSLDVIASYLTKNYSDSFIFFMTPYKCDWHEFGLWSNDNTQGYNLEDVANAVKQIANKYSIPVLDLFNEGQFELEMNDSGSDGLHPSQEFVTNYTAPQIARFIKDNYQKNER